MEINFEAKPLCFEYNSFVESSSPFVLYFPWGSLGSLGSPGGSLGSQGEGHMLGSAFLGSEMFVDREGVCEAW